MVRSLVAVVLAVAAFGFAALVLAGGVDLAQVGKAVIGGIILNGLD